jgi:adenosylmethionine-8-amino-7-oxononanoate aminotransferase
MSVGERGVFNAPYDPLLFDVERIPFPASGREQETFDALAMACRRGDVAALIVEPLILGAGGMLIYPPNVLAQMKRICETHEVLFIADEVMTGWGRTGTLLACEQAEIEPDILCLSKGLTGGAIPLAVTMASEPVFDAHRSEDRARMFFHSSSYTANPIACAAACANLAIWRDEPVMQRIASLGEGQAAQLNALTSHWAVQNPRQTGTITAFEVGEGSGYLSDLAPRMLALFREQSVLLRPLGNTIYVMPPYCISSEQLDCIYDTIREVIDDVT